MSDEVADRTPDAPPSQPVQSAGAVGRDVPLDGRAAQAGDLGGFRPRQATMQKPHDEHLSANMRLRVGIPFRVHHPLLVLGQGDPEHRHVVALSFEARPNRLPSGRELPCRVEGIGLGLLAVSQGLAEVRSPSECARRAAEFLEPLPDGFERVRTQFGTLRHGIQLKRRR